MIPAAASWVEAFLAREALIARAGIDEDWLASLGLAIVPISEVTDEGHWRAAYGAMTHGLMSEERGES
jgi:hypothetical protein